MFCAYKWFKLYANRAVGEIRYNVLLPNRSLNKLSLLHIKIIVVNRKKKTSHFRIPNLFHILPVVSHLISPPADTHVSSWVSNINANPLCERKPSFCSVSNFHAISSAYQLKMSASVSTVSRRVDSFGEVAANALLFQPTRERGRTSFYVYGTGNRRNRTKTMPQKRSPKVNKNSYYRCVL